MTSGALAGDTGSARGRLLASSMLRALCGLLVLAGAADALAQGLNGGLGFGYGAEGGVLQGAARGTGTGSTGGRAYYVTPALRARATLTDRVRGFLDYALTASFSANGEDSSKLYSTLSASVNAEVVPSRLFVDADARVSQQAISPFGIQSSDPSLNNSNNTQVRTISVSPYAVGQIAGQVNYVGRAYYTHTDSGTSSASNSTVWGALLGFDSTTRWSRLSWGLDFTYREASFSNRRTVFDQLNVFSLNYAVTPELRVSGRYLVETSNLASLDSETTTGYGGGLRWLPSPRTDLTLEYDQRFFGNSHFYGLNYRTPRTIWSLSNRQSLSTGQSNFGRGSPGSAYDLLFEQFATIEPDPVARAQLVNAFFQANGIDPNASLAPNYLPNNVVVQQAQQASVTWLGQRSTVILRIFQTQSESVLAASINPDDPFTGGNVLKWRGVGATWSHRLTPLSSLTINARGQRTTESLGDRETTYWTGMAMWSTRLAPRTTFSLSARYQNQSGTSSYNEAALLATLFMTF